MNSQQNELDLFPFIILEREDLKNGKFMMMNTLTDHYSTVPNKEYGLISNSVQDICNVRETLEEISYKINLMNEIHLQKQASTKAEVTNNIDATLNKQFNRLIEGFTAKWTGLKGY